MAEAKITPVNEIMSYSIEDEVLRIHLVADKEVEAPMDKLAQGLKMLAERVAKEETVQKIVVASWIIAEHPKVMEKFCFTVAGMISEEMRQHYFSNEKKAVWGAEMTRKTLLENYLV